MTRRLWNTTLALGLGLGLMSGCNRMATGSGAALPKVQPPAPLLTAQAAAPTGSPYHPLPTPPPYSRETDTAAKVDPAPAPEPALQQVEMRTEQPAQPPTIAGEAPLTVQPDLQPHVAEQPVITALRYLLDKRPADAMRFLKRYDQPNQDMLFSVLPLVERLSEQDLSRADPSELALWIEQLEGVIGPMRRRATLGLDRMCFCRRIERYGVYEPLPEDHAFRPGDPVQVYVELRNVSNESRDTVYETRLASSVRLTRVVDGKEQVEWEQGFPDRYQTDRTQAQRHDYFNNYRFSIPPNLPLGTYTLHLKVVDVPTGRIAERSLPLRLTTRPGG